MTEHIDPAIVEKATLALTNDRRERHGLSRIDRLSWAETTEAEKQNMRAALEAVADDLRDEALKALLGRLPEITRPYAGEPEFWEGYINTVKAEAWDEGAQAAWERSTPEVNGQNYYWRRDGEPVNPYRAAITTALGVES